MKIVRIFLFVLSFCALAWYLWQYFGKPNGKKYECDKKHSIYYKGTVTEEDAKKTCSYFKEIGYLAEDNEATIKIVADEKSKDTLQLHFIVQKDKIKTELEAAFLTLGSDYSQKVLHNKPVVVYLADKYFDDFRNLGYAKPLE
jgi:hypothetical protein